MRVRTLRGGSARAAVGDAADGQLVVAALRLEAAHVEGRTLRRRVLAPLAVGVGGAAVGLEGARGDARAGVGDSARR